jgi:hypothetical protein
MTAILAPVNLADVERHAPRGDAFMHLISMDTVEWLEARGKHLEAAAGRAIVGARMSALVAESKRVGYREAVVGRSDIDDAMDYLAAPSSGMR